MATKLTPAQRLERSHIQLMRSTEFAQLSGIMMMGESRIKDGVPTAYTNGRDKYYGTEFIGNLKEPELNFVVAHENFHVMFKHVTTWKHLWKKNRHLANAACDYVINLLIMDLGGSSGLVALPQIGVLYDQRFRGWDAGQVFDYLYKKVEEKQQSQQGQQCDNPPPDGEGDQQGEQGRGPVNADEFVDQYQESKGGGSLDEHDWENAESLSPEEREELDKAIDQAIRQGSILAGKLGGKTARDIGAIPEPKVDWREQLREFVTSVTAGRDASTWRRPSRRWLAHGMYMPSPYAESIGPAVIGIDTSGSIGNDEINAFLAEIKSITDTMPPERIHLLYWDTQVAGEETYMAGEYDSLVASTKPAGGGGTDPRCVQQYVQKMNSKPEFVLMLSDGYVSAWPEFGVPTMWAMTTKETAPNAVNIRL